MLRKTGWRYPGEGLRLERKAPPVEVLIDAERLECLVFLGYDPYFERDEPPGL